MRSQMMMKVVMGFAITAMSGVLMAPSGSRTPNGGGANASGIPASVTAIPGVASPPGAATGSGNCSGQATLITVNNCNIGRCFSAKFRCPQNFQIQQPGGFNNSGQAVTEMASPLDCNAIGQCPTVHPSQTPPTCVNLRTGFTTPATWVPGECSNRVATCGGIWTCSNPICRPITNPTVQCSFTNARPTCQVPATKPQCVR